MPFSCKQDTTTPGTRHSALSSPLRQDNAGMKNAPHLTPKSFRMFMCRHLELIYVDSCLSWRLKAFRLYAWRSFCRSRYLPNNALSAYPTAKENSLVSASPRTLFFNFLGSPIFSNPCMSLELYMISSAKQIAWVVCLLLPNGELLIQFRFAERRSLV